MKDKLKRFLALILVASFALAGTAQVYVSAENEEETLLADDLPEDGLADVDIEGEQPEEADTDAESIIIEKETKISQKCSKEYKLLRNFAIIEEDYDVDKVVTRGEFAAILTRMLGINDGEIKVFKDVFLRTANAKAIGIVTDRGLMSADEKGYFRPKDSVSVEDVAKAFFTLAGYDTVIDSYGGEAEGYKILAGENGLINPNPDGVMTWDVMAKIIYKALYINVIDLGNIKEYVEFERTSTKLLSILYGLKEGKGRVMATAYAAAKGRTVTDIDEVTIESSGGDWTYYIGNTDIKDYLGYEITFFYYEDDANDYIIATYIVNDNNTKVLEIKEKDFEGVNRPLTEVKYFEKNRTKTAKIENSAVMIYNGGMCYSLSQADFENADKITLIDTDSNKGYDICKIDSYDVYMAGMVSPEYGIISDKRDDRLLTVDRNQYDVSITKYGVEIGLDMIEEWDIVKVATTKPESNVALMNITVTSDLIFGKVEKKVTRDRIVTLSGKEYYISKSQNMDNLFGDVIVGLDEDMKIICFESESGSGRNYGYILQFKKEDQEAREVINVQFMNQKGEFVTLPLAEKFSINGTRTEWEGLCALIGKNSSPTKVKNDAYEQIFAYYLNSAGEIKRMYFAINEQGEEIQKGAVKRTEEDELILNKKLASARIWDNNGTVNSEYVYDSDTLCFSIVTDKDGKAIKELSQMFTVGQMRFSSGSRVAAGSRPPEVYCYDADDSRELKVLLVKVPYANLSTVSPTLTQMFFVEKVYEAANTDNEAEFCAEGYLSGSAMKVYADERSSVDISKWQRGDVYAVSFTTRGRILGATKAFGMNDTSGSVLSPELKYTKPAVTSTTVGYSSATVTNFAENINCIYGTIVEVQPDKVRVRPEGSTDDLVYIFQATKVYIYDTAAKKISVSSEANVLDGVGGKVFMNTRYGLARDILIIK